MKMRVIKALDFIKSLEEKNIGIISHCTFIKYFMEECGYHSIHPNNCETHTIDL